MKNSADAPDHKNAFGVPTYQYQIRLPGFSFEGPLDLLLQVIERNELQITEIALARIADEYISYINELNEVNPAELAEFLVIATKLVRIKSEALLPLPPARSGEAENAPSAAEELIAQLKEYRLVKEAAQFLRDRQEHNFRSYPSRRVGADEIINQQVNSALQQMGITPAPALAGVKLTDLLNLVRRRLNQQQQQQLKLPLPATQQDLSKLVRSIKIEDKIALIEAGLNEVEAQHVENSEQPRHVEFTALFDPANPPGSLEIIITFMAVLELLRRRQVEVRQDALFGEIYIERVANLFTVAEKPENPEN